MKELKEFILPQNCHQKWLFCEDIFGILKYKMVILVGKIVP